MTDPTEQTMRDGLAELVRHKPDLGSVDPEEAVAASRLNGPRGPGGPPVVRWRAVAAVLVVLVGLGAGLFYALPRSGPAVTAEPAAPGTPVVAPATPGTPLDGTTWLLSEINGGPAAIDAQGRVPTLTFDDRQVAADDTCNRLSGAYRLQGDRLSIDGLISTLIGCTVRGGGPDQRQQFQQGLERATRLELRGPTLTLSDTAGTPLLTFHAGVPGQPAATDVEVRVRNDATTDLGDVRVSFPSGTRARYGTLRPGEASRYERAGTAYAYAPVDATAAGKKLRLQPIDYVGETPLPPGRYTYVLTLDDGSLGLRLEADQ